MAKKTENTDVSVYFDDPTQVDSNMNEEQLSLLKKMIDATIENSPDVDAEIQKQIMSKCGKYIESRMEEHILNNEDNMRERVAWSPNLSQKNIDLFMEFIEENPTSTDIIIPFALNACVSNDILKKIYSLGSSKSSICIMMVLLLNPNIHYDFILEIERNIEGGAIQNADGTKYLRHIVRQAKAANKDTPDEWFRHILDKTEDAPNGEKHFIVLKKALANPKCPADVRPAIQQRHDHLRGLFDDLCIRVAGQKFDFI